MEQHVILQVSDVNKSFGGLQALYDVNLSVEEGTSTPSSARTAPASRRCSTARRPADARHRRGHLRRPVAAGPASRTRSTRLGIARVFQTPEIFGDLTVLENVMIPALRPPRRRLPVNACRARRRASASLRERAERMLDDVGLTDQRHMHRRRAVARRQAAAGAGDVPGAGAAAAAARRADRGHVARRHQHHHRAAEADQGDRGMTKVIIEHDMHVVFSLADRITVLAQGTPDRRGRPERIKGDPQGAGSLSRGAAQMSADRRRRTGQRCTRPSPRRQPRRQRRPFLSVPRHPRLLRRELHRAGRQLRRARGRDPGAARAQRRRQDLDAAHASRGRAARSCGTARSGSTASRCTRWRPPGGAAGMVLVPEDRRIIPGLTVEENLQLAQIAPPRRLVARPALRAFPAAGRAAQAGGRRRCRAASSRCWRSPARWPATSSCCCSTSPTRGWRRSSCRRSSGSWRRSSEQGITTIIVEQNAIAALQPRRPRGDPRHRRVVFDGTRQRGARERPPARGVPRDLSAPAGPSWL